MIKEIDLSKAEEASRLYSFCACRGNWYIKDNAVHFWKIYFDGTYTTEIIDPADLDDFIEKRNPLNNKNLASERVS